MSYNPKSLESDYEHSMFGHLGIELLRENETDEKVFAKMPVNDRTSQPFGVLSGGASIAFAEILAGFGSWRLIGEDELPVGTQVSANHISSVKKPDEIFAEATLMHKGRRTHLWNIDVRTKEGRLVSTVRVLNSIITYKPFS